MPPRWFTVPELLKVGAAPPAQNTPPVLQVPRTEDRARFAALGKELTAAKTKLDARKGAAKDDFAAWLKTAKPEDFANYPPEIRPPDMNMFEAFEKQAGLKLEAAKTGIQVLVVDKIERPTEN